MTARDLPESLQVEQSVLGALLMAGERAFDAVCEILVPEDFEAPAHRSVFAAASSLFATGQPIDSLVVWEYLGRPSDPSLAYLNTLVSSVPSAAGARRYAEMVRERSLLRRVGAIGSALHDASGQRGADPHAIASQAEADLIAALDRSSGDPVSLGEAVTEALTWIDERVQSGLAMSGISSGYIDLDAMTGGFEPGQLIVVAARPSVGKTALGCCIASHASEAGLSVLFWTGEMTRREIGQRVLALRSHVPMHAMRSGRMEDAHWPRMVDMREKADGEKLFIDEAPSITVSHLRAKARKMKRRHGLGLIVLDYLGLMTGSGENRVQVVGSISRGLKGLAKELAVPIIVLAQLNRGLESRGDKRPMLSDLRESGDIEQDADIVLMLHNESKHNDSPEWHGLAEVLIRKNRNGPTGDVLLTWLEQTGRFENTQAQSPRGFARSKPRDRAFGD